MPVPLEVVTRQAAPRLSPIALVLVVLAHLGVLLALASARIVPQDMPGSVLLVEVLRANPDPANNPEVKPVKPEVTPPKPARAPIMRQVRSISWSPPMISVRWPIIS